VELFFRDNHAADRLENSAPLPEHVELFDRVKAAYPKVFAEGGELRVLGGANINSRNFRFGRYYIKLLGDKADAEQVASLPAIAEALRAAGVPVGRFVPNRNSELISSNFYVQEWIPGDFYAGEPAQFEACLELLQRMKPALEAIAPVASQRKPFASWLPRAEAAVLFTTLSLRHPDAFDAKVLEAQGMLLELADACERTHFEAKHVSLQHFDLHPHNLLFEGARPTAALDLESVRVMDWRVAAGFNLFKLGRKAISKGLLSGQEFRKRAGAAFPLEELYPFARMEIFRRILVVLREHYFGEGAWDADLDKHLTGLKEARLMLG
jgi:hypothetical protein